MAGQEQQPTVPLAQSTASAVDTAMANINAQANQAMANVPYTAAPDPWAGLGAYEAARARAWSVPGATTPTMATPMPNPRMPVQPSLVPMRETQISAPGGSLYDRKTAKAQSVGNMIGNAIGAFANNKMQADYRDRVGTIEDFAKEGVRWNAAQRVLKNYPNDPAAMKVAADAKSVMTKMWDDPKQKKILEKAYPNYANPSDSDPAYTGPFNDAVKNVEAAKAGGNIGDDPQEQAVINKAQALEGKPPGGGQQIPFNAPVPQGMGGYMGPMHPNPDWTGQQQHPMEGRRPLIPGYAGQRTPEALAEAGVKPSTPQPPAWRPPISFPTELQTTPEYAAAMKQDQDITKAELEKYVPVAEKAASDQYRTQYMQDSQTRRRIMQDQTELSKKLMDVVERSNVADANNKTQLTKQAMASNAVVTSARIRANGMMNYLAAVDPRLASAMVGKFTKDNTMQIDALERAKAAEQKSIDDWEYQLGNDPSNPGHEMKKGPRRSEIEENINKSKARMRIYGTTIDGLNAANKQTTDALGQLSSAKGGAGGQGFGTGGGVSIPAPPPGTNQGYVRGVANFLQNPSLATGQQMTKTFETYQKFAYNDPFGRGERLIGYGHLIKKGENIGSELSLPDAERIFQQDYSDAQNKMVQALGPQTMQNLPGVAGVVLTDYMYQHGHFPKELTSAIQAGDWNKAADVIQKSDTDSRGTKLKALTDRFTLTSNILRGLAGGGGSNAAVAGGSPNSTSRAGETAWGNTLHPSSTVPNSQAPSGQAINPVLTNGALRAVLGEDYPVNPYVPDVPAETESTGDDSSSSQSAADDAADAAADAASVATN